MRTSGKDTAILIDGAFLRKTFEERFSPKDKEGNKQFIVHITTGQVIKNAYKLCELKRLFRIYYYDSSPYDGTRNNPISGKEINFSNTAGFHAINKFQKELARSSYVAFRCGHLIFTGWKYKEGFDFKNPPKEEDIIPALEQKCVDIKIGLDIAWLAIKRIVDRMIIVTADSDFIPVMKFARREGVEVVLYSLKDSINQEMLEHADEFHELALER
jgi:uncharacterized LabA/DUF88 family protein